MAKVVVTIAHDWREIANRAGGDPLLIMHDPNTNELEVPDVTQAALDAAFLDYTANQATIDQANANATILADKEKEKGELDTRRVLAAIVEGIVGEINLLRNQHGLPQRTLSQVRTAIKNKIDAG